MSISIIGAGNVGMALALHSRHAAKPWCSAFPIPTNTRRRSPGLGALAAIGSVEHAVDASDLIILAVPYPAAVSLAQSRSDWKGKILVDATNPLAAGLAGLSVGTTTSGAETIAQAAKGALEAFSDGVIAIIITIMVLGTEGAARRSRRRPAPLMPVFLSYVLSFIYVGIYWNNHHHMLQAVHKRHRRRAVGQPAPAVLAVALVPVRDRLDGREPFRRAARRRSTAWS
jgi:hypothetical protein